MGRLYLFTTFAVLLVGAVSEDMDITPEPVTSPPASGFTADNTPAPFEVETSSILDASTKEDPPMIEESSMDEDTSTNKTSLGVNSRFGIADLFLPSFGGINLPVNKYNPTGVNTGRQPVNPQYRGQQGIPGNYPSNSGQNWGQNGPSQSRYPTNPAVSGQGNRAPSSWNTPPNDWAGHPQNQRGPPGRGPTSNNWSGNGADEINPYQQGFAGNNPTWGGNTGQPRVTGNSWSDNPTGSAVNFPSNSWSGPGASGGGNSNPNWNGNPSSAVKFPSNSWSDNPSGSAVNFPSNSWSGPGANGGGNSNPNWNGNSNTAVNFPPNNWSGSGNGYPTQNSGFASNNPGISTGSPTQNHWNDNPYGGGGANPSNSWSGNNQGIGGGNPSQLNYPSNGWSNGGAPGNTGSNRSPNQSSITGRPNTGTSVNFPSNSWSGGAGTGTGAGSNFGINDQSNWGRNTGSAVTKPSNKWAGRGPGAGRGPASGRGSSAGRGFNGNRSVNQRNSDDSIEDEFSTPGDDVENDRPSSLGTGGSSGLSLGVEEKRPEIVIFPDSRKKTRSTRTPSFRIIPVLALTDI